MTSSSILESLVHFITLFKPEFSLSILIEISKDFFIISSTLPSSLPFFCRYYIWSILFVHILNENFHSDKLNKFPLANINTSGVVSLFVKYSLFGSFKNKNHGYSTFNHFQACFNGYEPIVKYLIEHGADVNKKDMNGITPSIEASRQGYKSIVKLLVEHNAEINKRIMMVILH